MITELPVETLIMVLRLLSYRDLIRCTSVCRQIRTVVKQSTELQYIIELGADGMVDNALAQPELSIADRLRMLLDRRRSWRELDWRAKVSLDLPDDYANDRPVVGGLIAKTYAEGDLSRIIAAWLPSFYQQEPRIVTHLLDFLVLDYALDPSQDLIAYLDGDCESYSIKIYLRTISSNDEHPEAALPELLYSFPASLDTSHSISIVDDIIGIFFTDLRDQLELIIWNWRTAGLLVMNYRIHTTLCFCPAAFMVTTTADGGAIKIYSFGDEPAVAPDELHIPECVATLQLPVLSNEMNLLGFDVWSNCRSPFIRKPMQEKLFQVARGSHVQLMTLQYEGFPVTRLYLCVHNRFLLSFVPPCPDDVGNGQVVPWDSWGPDNTRMFEEGSLDWMTAYVHGQRILLRSQIRPEVAVFMLDFNVHPKRKDDPVPLPDTSGGKGSFQLKDDHSNVPAGDIFQEDVVTRLPYSVTWRLGHFGNNSYYMMDEERIVGSDYPSRRSDPSIETFDIYFL